MTDARGVVQRYLTALGKRDIPTVSQLLAEDAEFWLPGDHELSGTWSGRDKILNGLFAALGGLFDHSAGYHLELRTIVAEGDSVVVECVSRSVSKTGQHYENPTVALFTVLDGRIKSIREYFDTQHFQQALFGTRPR